MSQMKLHVLYLPSKIVSGAYFHRRGLSFAMMYFLNYIHLSIWSFYKACNVLLMVDKHLLGSLGQIYSPWPSFLRNEGQSEYIFTLFATPSVPCYINQSNTWL